MDPTPEQIARAFSSHQFAETYEHLAPDVRWVSIGGSVREGRDAVIAACEESNEYLATATTDFRSFRTVVGADAVVVDSLAQYVGADGDTSVVASCDIFDFAAGKVALITTYAVELSDD